MAAAPYEQTWLDRGSDRIGVQLYPEPERPVPAPARVVIWPAMGVPARFYRPFASALRSA
ncbi:MAG: alpha/beta fold hydrolase, partial [Natronosporangium sp.]